MYNMYIYDTHVSASNKQISTGVFGFKKHSICIYQSRERVQQTDIDGRVDIQLDTCTRVERALQNRKAPGGCFAPSVVRLDGTPRIACAGCQFLLGVVTFFSHLLQNPLKMNPTFFC